MHFLTVALVPSEVGQEAGAVERYIEKQMLAHFHPDSDGWAGPTSKFDYYGVGGNFDGLLHGLTGQPSEEPTSFWQRLVRRRELRLRRNSCSPEDLRKHLALWVNAPTKEAAPEEGVLPAAVLTPDGTWHGEILVEEGVDELIRWLTEVVAILQDHGDCTAVGLDCHI